MRDHKPTICILSLAILIGFLPALWSERNIKIPLSTTGGGEYISLVDLVKATQAGFSLDVAMGRIRLYREEHFALISVGYSHMILDGRLYKADRPVIRDKGEVIIPLSFGLALVEKMTGMTMERDGDFLVSVTPLQDEKKKPEIIQPPSSMDRIAFIILDAGHGGKDPGAVGRGGLREKDITLPIARYVRDYLKKNLHDVDIVLSRNRDIFLELGERTDLANRRLARGVNGMFVSIHVNASLVPQVSGFETYFLSQNPSNEDARSTAALENGVIVLEEKSAGGKRYGDVDYIEAMMLTTQIQKESSLLAGSIQAGLDRQVSEFKSNGVKKADFFVLRGALMPAALVEVGYLTNSRESGYLRNKSYQNRLARGIGDGIIDFLKKYNRMISKQQAE